MEGRQDARAREELAAFLIANEAGAEFALFDFVAIDEAHYMRNPATASHQIGQMLADAAGHLALLTATPIQIGSENLFNLLRLIDPDRFTNIKSYSRIQTANSSVTKALNAIRNNPHDEEGFLAALAELAASRFFHSDTLISGWRDSPPDLANIDERIHVSRLLEERSLLANIFTRTRKRDVIANRVIRDPRVIQIELNPEERAIYDEVTRNLRRKAHGASTFNTLALIARQRQLASSIPAAVRCWRDNPDTAELLEEDLGRVIDEARLDGIGDDALPQSALDKLNSLEAHDTKYTAFLDFTHKWRAQYPNEKIIVFSFFRGTLRYLERRLMDEGISTALIMGGMGDEKDEEIERFKNLDGPPILLSSEVGSEGIDLQFSRVVVNYDLPWNPMRVEQRIGRVDRLGQRIRHDQNRKLRTQPHDRRFDFERLYERIGVFRESIGDIEEILGSSINELVVEYFRDDLTDEQVAQRLDQNAYAATQHKRSVAQLEEEAPEFAGMDFILEFDQIRTRGGPMDSLRRHLRLLDGLSSRTLPRITSGSRPRPNRTLSGSA